MQRYPAILCYLLTTTLARYYFLVKLFRGLVVGELVFLDGRESHFVQAGLAGDALPKILTIESTDGDGMALGAIVVTATQLVVVAKAVK